MSTVGGNQILDTFKQFMPNGGLNWDNSDPTFGGLLGGPSGVATSGSGTPSSGLPSSVNDLGAWAASTAAGRAKGRTDQANFNLLSGQAQQQANVGTADANLRQRAAAMADALRGRMLQGTTDATISGTPFGVNPPTIAGGPRPSNIVGAADLGKSVAAHGDAGLASPGMTPENFSGLAPKPTAADTALNALGYATPILSTLGKFGVPGVGGGAGAATSEAMNTIGNIAGAVGGGVGAATGIASGNPVSAGLGGALSGLSLAGPWGAAIGGGAAALGALARSLGGNETNRQREAFAKGITGTSDTNAFDSYLRANLDPATAQSLIYRAHRVIGRNDTTANGQWMHDVTQALQRGKGVNTATNFDPLTGQVRG